MGTGRGASAARDRRRPFALSSSLGASTKIELRLFHEDAANYLAVEQCVPFGPRSQPASPRRAGQAHCGDLADAHILNGVSAPPEVDLHVPDLAFIKRVAIQRPVDVIANRPRQESAGDTQEGGQHEHDEASRPPARAPFGRRTGGLAFRRRHAVGGASSAVSFLD